MASDYAPDLEVAGSLGTSAGVVDVSAGFVEVLLNLDGFRYIMVMTMVAQEAAYGADVAPPGRLLTDFGIEQMSAIHEMCASELGGHFAEWTSEELFVEDWTLDLADLGHVVVWSCSWHHRRSHR